LKTFLLSPQVLVLIPFFRTFPFFAEYKKAPRRSLNLDDYCMWSLSIGKLSLRDPSDHHFSEL